MVVCSDGQSDGRKEVRRDTRGFVVLVCSNVANRAYYNTLYGLFVNN